MGCLLLLLRSSQPAAWLSPPGPHAAARPPVCAALQVEFGQIYLSKPIFIEADGETAVLFPKEARLRNLTYAAPLYVDIERRDKAVHPDGSEEVDVMPYQKVYLGDVRPTRSLGWPKDAWLPCTSPAHARRRCRGWRTGSAVHTELAAAEASAPAGAVRGRLLKAPLLMGPFLGPAAGAHHAAV